jgi:hypothetical protein
MLDLLANIGPALPGALWNFPSHGETVIRDDPTAFNIQLFKYIYILHYYYPLGWVENSQSRVAKCIKMSPGF